VKDELTKKSAGKRRKHKRCLKLADLFAQYSCLKNTSLVLIRNLFQRPKKAVDEGDEVWYDNMVVGQRTLGDKMKKLSIEAKLSCA